MQNKKLGWLIAAAGVGIVAVSLAADALGIGAQPEVIGWKQWLGAAVGAGLLAVGVWLALRKVGVD